MHDFACSDCIETCMILHGSCPFDGNEISNLQMSDTLESISHYLNRNYREIITKMCHKHMNKCIQNINEVIELHSAPNFIDQIKKYQKLTGFIFSINSDRYLKSDISFRSYASINKDFFHMLEIFQKIVHESIEHSHILYIHCEFLSIYQYIGYRCLIILEEYKNCAQIKSAKKSSKKNISTLNNFLLNYNKLTDNILAINTDKFRINTDKVLLMFDIGIGVLIKELQNILRIKKKVL